MSAAAKAAKSAKAAAGAGAAAAAAAAKSAKAAAGAAAASAAAAAKAAGKSAGAAASSAAAAAKKAAGSAADIGKRAGKNLDSAGDAAKAGGKNLDTAADAAKAGKKARKLSDAAPLLAGAGLLGGMMYIENKLEKENEKIRGCTSSCLPTNYDELIYGDLKKDKLQYKTLEELKAADPKVPDDQPLCTKAVDDCGSFCTDKCKEKHQSDIPGSNILGRGADAVGDMFDAINPFKGVDMKMVGIGLVVLFVLLIFGPIIFRMIF